MLLENSYGTLELIEKLVLLFFGRSQVFLHEDTVLEGCLNDEDGIFVVLIHSKFLVDQVVGFALLGSEL